MMQATLQQAQTLHQQGKFPEAEVLYRKLLDEEPNNPLFNARLSLLLAQTQRMRDALPYISCALGSLPNNPDLLSQGVSIAVELAENSLAEEWLLNLIKLKPSELALQEQLAGILIGNHKENDALLLTKSIIKKAPNNANVYNLKGLALSRLGETDKGYKAFQKALKLNPGQLAVIKNLLVYSKGKKEPLLDTLIPQLEQKLLTENQAPSVKMNVAYILSMYFEKFSKPEKSFHYLKLGNDINRSSYQYSHDATVSQFNTIMSSFNETLNIAFQGKGLDDASPIFILGMPRSGTTLIEQILSSHSLVEAEGEMIELKMNVEKQIGLLDDGASVTDKISKSLAVVESYLHDVRTKQSAAYFTDKMPYNFMFVGLIAMALPNAKIIHCTRDPLETCFSIYKQNFSGSHAYTNELTELGQYYCQYKEMMDYWKTLFGDRIYEANYESMVADSGTQIERLLNYCQLDAEPACFEFHKNTRAVRTASVNQVRQPIYKSALNASAPYQKQLAPLINALGIAE